MEFKGTKGNLILDASDMLTIRAVDNGNRVFIAKCDTYNYYKTGFYHTIASEKDTETKESLSHELNELKLQDYINARLFVKSKEMLELILRINESPTTKNAKLIAKSGGAKRHWSIHLEELINYFKQHNVIG